MNLHCKGVLLDTKDVGGQKVFRFLATSDVMDRQDEIVSADGWETESFMKNPVFMGQHDYSTWPIGKVIGLEKSPGGMISSVIFDEADPEAMKVKGKYERGFLNAVSVGFRSLARDGARYGKDPLKHTKQELLEISAVAIPANPDALMLRGLEHETSRGPEEDFVFAVEKAPKTSVQSVVCSKDRFQSADDAASWVKAHNFSAAKVDETDQSYRFRQFEPSACTAGSFRNIDLTDGVSAVICRKKEQAAGVESGETATKAGRVLSAANEATLKQCAEMLQTLSERIAGVLAQVAKPSAMGPDGMPADMPMKPGGYAAGQTSETAVSKGSAPPDGTEETQVDLSALLAFVGR